MSLPKPELYIGADPEFFVRRNGHFISAHVFKCGTKRDPMKTANGFIQVDGMALEANVTPAKTKPDFIKNVRSVMEDLQSFIQVGDKANKLVAVPAVRFSKNVFTGTPDENKKLGCEIDFNAYTGKENPKPDETSEYRTGAGHIHLGWTQVMYPRSIPHMVRCRSLVRQLDYYLGLPSLLWDKDPTRRRLYGAAGAFRPKHYGLEYRVLSNKWLSSGDLTGFVFTQAQKAFNAYWANEVLDNRFHGLAQEIINQGRVNWRKTYPDIARAVL